VNTLDHHGDHGQTQEQRVLMLLQSAYPCWVPAPALARISLQYCARIHSLRRKGWEIANKVEHKDGQKHGFFRLAQPMTYPNPRKAAPDAASNKGSNPTLFDLTWEHRDDG
jgi:hypothetical protein